METFISAIAVGGAVGILAGLLGIGGGTVMIPILRLGFGLPALAATATSLFVIVPTSIFGCIGHLRNKTCDLPLGVATGLAGALTSLVGVWLASQSPAWLIMSVAAVIMGYSAYTMIRKAIAMTGRTTVDGEVSQSIDGGDSLSEDATVRVTSGAIGATSVSTGSSMGGDRRLLKGALIGLVAGLASGYVGVGGGFLMVPAFISILGLSMKTASGTSLTAMVLLAIPGVFEQVVLGNVDFAAGIALAIGSIPGALLGARLVPRIPERSLRFAFSICLVGATIALVVNEFVPIAAA